MRVWEIIGIIGIIIIVLGIIFHLQGQSMLGPESSFMYANPEWISYGIQIAVFGLITLGLGIAMKFIQRG